MGPGDKQRQGAKDTHIYPWLTWLTVRYWLGTGYQVCCTLCVFVFYVALPIYDLSFQDKMVDLVDHIILLAQRVEQNLF